MKKNNNGKQLQKIKRAYKSRPFKQNRNFVSENEKKSAVFKQQLLLKKEQKNKKRKVLNN